MENKRIDIEECEYINGFCYKTGMLCKDVAFCNIRRIQQLKQDNESSEYQLEKRIEICDSWMNLSNKYKTVLDEIEEIILKRQKEHYCYCDECSPFKEILQLIKQAKED